MIPFTIIMKLLGIITHEAVVVTESVTNVLNKISGNGVGLCDKGPLHCEKQHHLCVDYKSGNYKVQLHSNYNTVL